MEPLLMMSGLIVFPPALLVFYTYLKPYQKVYREDWSFYALVFGMFMGMISGLLHYWTLGTPLSIFLNPIYDALFISVILNTSRLKGKRATVYYGASLGIGYGAMITVIFAYVTLLLTDNVAGDVMLYVFLAFSFAMLFGGCGAYIGLGSTRKELFRYAVRGTLMMLPLYLFIDMAMIGGIWTIVPLMGLLIYGYIIFQFTRDTILPLGRLRK